MLETNYVVLEYKRINNVKGLMNIDLCICFHLTNSIVALCNTHTRAVENNVRYKWLTFRVVGTRRVNALHVWRNRLVYVLI